MLYIPEAARKFSSLEEYVAWHKEKHKKRFKERIPRGEGHTRAKLTEAQVVEIRRAYYGGKKTGPQLCAEYGIGRSSLGYLLTGKTWGHIREGLEEYDAEAAQYTTPEEIKAWKQKRKTQHVQRATAAGTKLTADQVRAIRAEYAENKVHMKDLADKYGVKTATVSDLIAKRTWKHI